MVLSITALAVPTRGDGATRGVDSVFVVTAAGGNGHVSLSFLFVAVVSAFPSDGHSL